MSGPLNNLPFTVADVDGSLQAELRYHFARVASYECKIGILALNVEPFGYEAIIFDPEMRRSEFLKVVNLSISLKRSDYTINDRNPIYIATQILWDFCVHY